MMLHSLFTFATGALLGAAQPVTNEPASGGSQPGGQGDVTVALEGMNKQMKAFGAAVAGWSDLSTKGQRDFSAMMPLLKEAMLLQVTHDQATCTVKNARQLTPGETNAMITVGSKLLLSTKNAMNNLKEAKPEFDKIAAGPLLYPMIGQMQSSLGVAVADLRPKLGELSVSPLVHAILETHTTQYTIMQEQLRSKVPESEKDNLQNLEFGDRDLRQNALEPTIEAYKPQHDFERDWSSCSAKFLNHVRDASDTCPGGRPQLAPPAPADNPDEGAEGNGQDGKGESFDDDGNES